MPELYLQKKEKKSPDEGWYLIMMDIDRFKHVNDTYDHLEGDHALQLTARALQQCFSSRSGCLVRYGGDEFAAVIKSNEDDLCQLKAEITEALHTVHNDYKLKYPLSVSMGCQRLIVINEQDIIQSMKKADERMYEMKQGRKMENAE